jgi:hypothetical protein
VVVSSSLHSFAIADFLCLTLLHFPSFFSSGALSLVPSLCAMRSAARKCALSVSVSLINSQNSLGHSLKVARSCFCPAQLDPPVISGPKRLSSTTTGTAIAAAGARCGWGFRRHRFLGGSRGCRPVASRTMVSVLMVIISPNASVWITLFENGIVTGF